jgi:hypothetical protein
VEAVFTSPQSWAYVANLKISTRLAHTNHPQSKTAPAPIKYQQGPNINVFTNLQSPAKNNTLSLCDATFWPSQNEKPQPPGGFNQPTKVEYRPYKVKHWISSDDEFFLFTNRFSCPAFADHRHQHCTFR